MICGLMRGFILQQLQFLQQQYIEGRKVSDMSYIDKVLSYSPIAYWPVNEAGGNDMFDQSGNGYDGTYTGVTLGQTGIGDGETIGGFNGNQGLFDGTTELQVTDFKDLIGTLSSQMRWVEQYWTCRRTELLPGYRTVT